MLWLTPLRSGEQGCWREENLPQCHQLGGSNLSLTHSFPLKAPSAVECQSGSAPLPHTMTKSMFSRSGGTGEQGKHSEASWEGAVARGCPWDPHLPGVRSRFEQRAMECMRR